MRLVTAFQICSKLTLCDRFGNFIGEPEDSDIEQEQDVDANDYLYDQDEPDEVTAAHDQQLMEVDGTRCFERVGDTRYN